MKKINPIFIIPILLFILSFIFIESIIFSIITLVITTLVVIILNLLIKIKKYENIIMDTKNNIENVMYNMKGIDKTGAFESDDYVGVVFKKLKEEVSRMEDFFQEDN